MADKDWQRGFEDPIPLPGGRTLITLREAADYITSLPKKESDLPEWQTAIEVLMLVSRSGPTMMARIGVMKALNCHVERTFNPERKDHHSGRTSRTWSCPLSGPDQGGFSSMRSKLFD